MRVLSALKQKARKIILGYRASSNDYIAYLRKHGAKIGNNVQIFSPNRTTIDTTTPYMLTIGNDVLITGPVTILTHDYSTRVVNVVKRSSLATIRPVTIGNNVFLGWGCTILSGSVIDDNTVIGAGAVVSGRLEANSVYAGNPAKRIMSVDEYFERIKARQLEDAVQLYLHILDANKCMPTKSQMWAYRNVFRSDININGTQTYMFETYDDFVRYVMEERTS